MLLLVCPGDALTIQFPCQLIREGIARVIPFSTSTMGPRQMAGFAKCSRGNHVLTSVHVEAVPALGALPAGSNILVVACPTADSGGSRPPIPG
jgi:hypothetical protein